ncbi:MAG: hypothetical protein COA97_09400 [Flavobacteriales bacterium]|nr:MAG: hypothetical protein COA97_09400 [Flavobacteriales bacterium]
MNPALLTIAIIIIPFLTIAQTEKSLQPIVAGSEQYQELKASGELNTLIENGIKIIVPQNPISSTQKVKEYEGGTPLPQIFASACYGYTPPTTPSQTPALSALDDGTIGPISIPFSFCLYGTNYTQFYVNGNGNVTFTNGFITYTSSGFPTALTEMLAPFWGDVDFNGAPGGQGGLYYEVQSDYVKVHWVDVGYYSSHYDKLNTFELIFTDGNATILPPGKNVGFLYDDMNWTTGDASGGTNGFGGSPATVGVNKGDGIDFIQVGLFDQPGNAYDGPQGSNDGVDWLDNKSFFWNVCNSTNQEPSFVGIDICDTVRVCVGDTVQLDITFLANDVTDSSWASIDTTNVSGLTINSNTSGNGSNSCIIFSTFIATINNVGTHVVSYSTWDNGTPPDTINFTITIVVDTISLLPTITGDTTYCPGDSVLLNATIGFDSYLWNTSASDTLDSIYVTQGSYTVQGFLGGCSVTTPPFIVTESPAPIVNITGSAIICFGDSALLNATSGYDTYLWSTSTNDTLDSVYVTQGNYTVTVTDSLGCKEISSPFNVVMFIPVNTITGQIPFCPNETITISSVSGFSSYLWNTGSTTQSITVGAGEYIVTVTDGNGCTDIDTLVLVAEPAPLANFTIDPLTQGGTNQPITFTDASTISFGNVTSWAWDFDVTSIGGANPSFANTQGPHIILYSLQGTYSVSLTVIADNNCQGIFMSEYLIVDDIIVPTIFTPNGDSHNEFLVFKNLEFHSGNKLVVFNRWGGKVFEQENYANDWNGDGNSVGTYYFILTVEDLEEIIKGTITILK